MLRGKKIQVNLRKHQNLYNSERNINPKEYYQKKLKTIISVLRKKKYDLYYQEITTREIKNFGIRCVNVVYPPAFSADASG